MIGKIQSQTTANPCSISQAAAIEALLGPQDCIATALKHYRARRDLMVDGLVRLLQTDVSSPDGAFYVFPKVTALLGRPLAGGQQAEDDVTLPRIFLEKGNVACVPGAAFGAPGYIRFSFATSEAEISAALDRLEGLLAS